MSSTSLALHNQRVVAVLQLRENYWPVFCTCLWVLIIIRRWASGNSLRHAKHLLCWICKPACSTFYKILICFYGYVNAIKLTPFFLVLQVIFHFHVWRWDVAQPKTWYIFVGGECSILCLRQPWGCAEIVWVSPSFKLQILNGNSIYCQEYPTFKFASCFPF